MTYYFTGAQDATTEATNASNIYHFKDAFTYLTHGPLTLANFPSCSYARVPILAVTSRLRLVDNSSVVDETAIAVSDSTQKIVIDAGIQQLRDVSLTKGQWRNCAKEQQLH
jgi:hypothetical protein